MKSRIFMNIPEIFSIANNLSKYADTQTSMIDKYHLTAKKMIADMEGKSRNNLEIATYHIKNETFDAIGRLSGFNYVYKSTGTNRLLIDKEGAEAAKINRILQGTGIGFPGSTLDNDGTENCHMLFLSLIDSETKKKIAKIFSLTVKEVESILKGYIPHNVTNDQVVEVLQYVANMNLFRVSSFTIAKNRQFNSWFIDKVYESGQYIENQNDWDFIHYGDYSMAHSGCGIIAIINACHSLGIDLTDEEVLDLISEFEKNGCVLGAAAGTSPMAIVDYFLDSVEYEVTYTTSNDPAVIKAISETCDTFIVDVYNDSDDITKSMHYVNIEKRVDENGNVKYVVHNSSTYYDSNGDHKKQNDEPYIESKEYNSLEEAINDVNHDNNSRSVMIIGISNA